MPYTFIQWSGSLVYKESCLVPRVYLPAFHSKKHSKSLGSWDWGLTLPRLIVLNESNPMRMCTSMKEFNVNCKFETAPFFMTRPGSTCRQHVVRCVSGPRWIGRGAHNGKEVAFPGLCKRYGPGPRTKACAHWAAIYYLLNNYVVPRDHLVKSAGAYALPCGHFSILNLVWLATNGNTVLLGNSCLKRALHWQVFVIMSELCQYRLQFWMGGSAAGFFFFEE
jgi:hypothetical protein